MKLIKQVKLAFKEGNSDKVYQVDLCDLDNNEEQRFLVNFRYGRRGATLKEGTKTPSPVDLKKAEALFTSVVVSKTNKGYYDEAEGRPQKVANTANFLDLNLYLDAINDEKESATRARMIWRLPQQANDNVASKLAAGLGQGDYLEDYSRLWVIGRTGNEQHANAVLPFLADKNETLQSLALEVLLQLKCQRAQQFLQTKLACIPSSLMQAIERDDDSAMTAELAKSIADPACNCNQLLKALYLRALTSTTLHKVLLETAKTLPFTSGFFAGIRYLLKMAEFRFDSQMFALLYYRVEKTPGSFDGSWGYTYIKNGKKWQKVDTKEELAKPDSRLAYSENTQKYLTRRAWRVLRRLGLRDDDRYASLASQLLLQYGQKDSKGDKVSEYYNWETEKNTKRYYDGYSRYLAFNAILRTHSDRYKLNKSKTCWIMFNKQTDTGRTEAFPAIWDRNPQVLLNLLIHTDIDFVGQFAKRVLSDNPSFNEHVTNDDLCQLLVAKNSAAIEFASEILSQRDVSDELLVLLLKTGNEAACAVALDKLQEVKNIIKNQALLLKLLPIDHQALTAWLSTQFANYFTIYSEETLLTLFLASLNAEPASFSELHASWLVGIFVRYYEKPLARITLDELEPLIMQQACIGVQLFATRLLVASSISLAAIPGELTIKLNTSSSPIIRAASISLYSKMSQSELLQQLPSLVELVYFGEAPERQACLELMRQLQPTYDKQLFEALFPLVFREEKVNGQQQDLFEFLTEELNGISAKLDQNTIWRLVHASAASAQRLGAFLFNQCDITQFTVKQWTVFANNANATIRQRIYRAFEEHVEFVKGQSIDALNILESRWEQTRTFGFEFFKKHYQEQDWSAELIITMCDSNLDDTQTYGRELLQTFFKKDQGEFYLTQLSQHPSLKVQGFVSRLLDEYASGKPDVILSLKHYFTSVLSQVNKGRVSKDSVLAFLIKEANCNQQVLEMVSALFTRLSLTLVHKDKSQLIKAMLMLHKQHPDLVLPIEKQTVRVLSAIAGEHHAG